MTESRWSGCPPNSSLRGQPAVGEGGLGEGKPARPVTVSLVLSLEGLIITHCWRPTSTERDCGGRKAGIVHEPLAGQQAHVECGALGAISIALRSPDEIGASSPALKAAVSWS